MKKIIYSHRNGEVKEPTEEGFYFVKDMWFEEVSLKIVFCNGIYTFRLWENPQTGVHIITGDHNGRFAYYGPIPKPEIR